LLGSLTTTTQNRASGAQAIAAHMAT